MKRLAVALMIAVLCVGFGKNLIAGQSRTEVFTNIGGLIYYSSAGFFFVGATIDNNIGSSLVLSLDANVLCYIYMPLAFQYGGVLNFKFNNTFFGGGISRLQSLWAGGEGITMLKMNAGIKMKKTKVSLSIYSNLEKTFGVGTIIVGIEIGFRIK